MTLNFEVDGKIRERVFSINEHTLRENKRLVEVHLTFRDVDKPTGRKWPNVRDMVSIGVENEGDFMGKLLVYRKEWSHDRQTVKLYLAFVD